MAWEIEVTNEFTAWFHNLTEDQQDRVASAVNILSTREPGLARPFVDTLEGSRFRNMKELRPHNGNLRVLFAFDPRRTAILLAGGDKTDNWRPFYDQMIKRADALYAEHLRAIREKGLLR